MPTLQELQAAHASATNAAQQAYASLQKCHCGKGKQGGQCVPLTTVPAFGASADPSKCFSPPFINDCKSDCCSKDTCVTRVNDYNGKIGAMNAAKLALDSYVPTTAEVTQANQAAEDQEANRKLRNNIIIGVVVFFFLLIIYFIYRRSKNSSK